MKRFLAVFLGAALAAAPLSAQTDAGAKASELLEKAQAAAAAGDAAKAAELARAAAELLAAAPQAFAGFDGAVTIRSRPEPAPAVEEARIVETRDGVPAGAWLAAPGDGAVILRQAAPAAEGGETVSPATPPRAFSFGGAGPLPAAGMAAPRAAQQDELGATLKLIHAEVQALRAEVQAMRAEISLMRARGAAAPQAFSFGIPMPEGQHQFRLAVPQGMGEWHPAAPGARAKVLFVGPDGKPVEMTPDVLLEWSERDCEECAECEDGLCAECEEVAERVDLKDLPDSLRMLGYVGGGLGGGSASERRLLLRQVPLKDAVIRERVQRPEGGEVIRYEIRTTSPVDPRPRTR